LFGLVEGAGWTQNVSRIAAILRFHSCFKHFTRCPRLYGTGAKAAWHRHGTAVAPRPSHDGTGACLSRFGVNVLFRGGSRSGRGSISGDNRLMGVNPGFRILRAGVQIVVPL